MISPDPSNFRATDLPEYYSRRAAIYEEMWRRDDPTRQTEQAEIVAALRARFRGRRVLEVACGTGYWTQFVAGIAASIYALDASAEMLHLARAKGLPAEQVQFAQGDAYALDQIPGTFDAGLANFWISHIPRARVAEFLSGFHRRLEPGASVLLADNVYVPGVGGELYAPEGSADTFKLRVLPDGSRHQVLKNYYSAEELTERLRPWSDDLRVSIGHHFWQVQYRVRFQ